VQGWGILVGAMTEEASPAFALPTAAWGCLHAAAAGLAAANLLTAHPAALAPCARALPRTGGGGGGRGLGARATPPPPPPSPPPPMAACHSGVRRGVESNPRRQQRCRRRGLT
jgi:hypothetical protein